MLNGITLQPLSGAVVMVGTNGPYSTDAGGKYVTNPLNSGTYDLMVSKSGYDTWRGSITLNPSQSAQKNIMVRHPSGWVTPTYSGLTILPDRVAV